MKKFASLLSLILMFAMSSVLASVPNFSAANGSSVVKEKQLPLINKAPATSEKTFGLLAEPLYVEAHQPVVVLTRFTPPPIKLIFVPPKVIIPLIGWKNIDCYGGTGAKLARG